MHTLLAVKQNKMCFSFNESNQCELYVNPPEQIFAEKVFSFAKIGVGSERFRDIDDMYYLITNCSLNISVVRECLSIITMNEPYGIKDTYDVVEKVVDYLNDPFFRNNYVRNNGSWLEIDYSISKEAITAFLYKL